MTVVGIGSQSGATTVTATCGASAIISGMRTEELLSEAFARAGVTAGFHALDLTTGAEIGIREDEAQVAASVFKVPVLIGLLRGADKGEVDLSEQITVPADGRVEGPTGLSVMTDPVTMSLRDLARLMIVVSDNAATDVVIERLGIAAINVALKELGCTGTAVMHDVRGLFDTVIEDAGLRSVGELGTPTAEQLDSWRAMRPLETNHTTARDMTHLLRLLWADEAASPKSCELGRQTLQQQVWPHRLASGFPEDEVVTAGKTGTLPRVRNEVGVVSCPDGSSYAVAVFTTAEATTVKHPAADAVIGEAARIAVDALRGGRTVDSVTW
jgi:beta-lactamase class A